MTPFTKQQLFKVRNEIDIDWLINEKLNIERQFNGAWRFRCPLCQQLNTATQKKTNLARCFSCQKNFNTIDIVIYTKKINFVPSVRFLLSLLDKKTSQSGADKKDNDEIKGAQQKELKAINRIVALQEIERIKQVIR
ncbi:MAG: CHC2 zinc finger domain-containing protein [Methylococcaceae bacterium]